MADSHQVAIVEVHAMPQTGIVKAGILHGETAADTERRTGSRTRFVFNQLPDRTSVRQRCGGKAYPNRVERMQADIGDQISGDVREPKVTDESSQSIRQTHDYEAP